MKKYSKPSIQENNITKFEGVYACSGNKLDDSTIKPGKPIKPWQPGQPGKPVQPGKPEKPWK